MFLKEKVKDDIIEIKDISKTTRFAIYDNKKIISRLYIRDKQDDEPVYLFRLKTNQSYRLKGYATKLIDKVIKKYKHRGIILRACGPMPGLSTTALMKIYKKFGFKRKGKTKTMYIDPPRELQEGDRVKTKCPNCGNCMTVTSMSYLTYSYGYDDLSRECSSNYGKGIKCKRCKLEYAGGTVTYKKFTVNCWDKDNSLKEWVDKVNAGEGKSRIEY